MSQKERSRLIVMQQVKDDELTLAEACEVLGLSYRQTKRVWRRYRLEGDKGLVHGLRGQPGSVPLPPLSSNASWPAMRNAIRISAPRWQRSIWPPKAWRWITRRCGGGVWPRASRGGAAAASGIDNGGNASRALERWCNWTVRTTTGLKDAAGDAC